jgi:hypothetical protein
MERLMHGPGMVLAAYAIIAQAQPVMASGLRPAPFAAKAHGTPSSGRDSSASALADLADLDDL